MSLLVDQIEAAFDTPEPDQAITQTKHAVIEEIQRLAPETAVHNTDYFNHSYHPDLVMKWHEHGQQRERNVFLRLAVTDPDMREDLSLLRATEPLLIGLLDHRASPESSAPEPVADNVGDEAVPVREVAAEDYTLVTEARALDALGEREGWTADATVATSPLVRSGFGWLSNDRAEDVQRALTAGFSAATGAQTTGPIQGAVDALRGLLPEGDERRLKVYLDLLWLGSGGSPDALTDLESLLSEDLEDVELAALLRHFVEGPDAADADFWARVGKRFTGDEIAKLLNPTAPSDNLTALVQANLDRWTMRYAVLLPKAPSSQAGGARRWRVEDEALTLDMGGSAARFSNRKGKFNRWGSRGTKIPVRDLTRSLQGDGVIDLDVSDDETSVLLSSRTGTPLPQVNIDRLHEWSELAGRAKLSLSLEERTPAATFDFERLTVQADEAISLRALVGRTRRYLGRAALLDPNPGVLDAPDAKA